MEFPGGWNALALSEPRPIKQIIAAAEIYDGAATHQGVIQLSNTYFNPTGGTWTSCPFALDGEPVVEAVNYAMFLNEKYKADAMNQQTKMANLTDAPPPLANLLYIYGNENGNLLYQMAIPLALGGQDYSYLELSVMENAATLGGAQGVVEVFHFEKTSGNFTNDNTLKLFFEGFFGAVNLGLRGESTTPNSQIFELRCNIFRTKAI